MSKNGLVETIYKAFFEGLLCVDCGEGEAEGGGEGERGE